MCLLPTVEADRLLRPLNQALPATTSQLWTEGGRLPEQMWGHHADAVGCPPLAAKRETELRHPQCGAAQTEAAGYLTTSQPQRSDPFHRDANVYYDHAYSAYPIGVH